MGKLSRPDIFEAVFWLLISVIFFVVSFSFNQPIEIYKFGATGWPRVILFLMALVCLGNFYYAYSKGSKAQEGRVGAKENDEPIEYTSIGQYFKTGMVLMLPLVYALSLKPVGFYSGTPIFIALIMIAWGERRVRFILINTILIYAILVVLFMLVLNAPLPQGNMSPFYDISAFMLKTKTQLDQMF
ncbi:MAG: tripartite tricarboxylate transporter TctB family protein [Paracoccaceae bacterium]